MIMTTKLRMSMKKTAIITIALCLYNIISASSIRNIASRENTIIEEDIIANVAESESSSTSNSNTNTKGRRILLEQQPNEEEYITGSFENCDAEKVALVKEKLEKEQRQEPHQVIMKHPDSSFITVSCLQIHYRIPNASIVRARGKHGEMGPNSFYSPSSSSPPPKLIIIGVLSAAQNKSRRKAIRCTWGYRRTDVFFVVGGPWQNIKDEYLKYGDILWLDLPETYEYDDSTLTYKTEAFLAIMYHRLPFLLKGETPSSCQSYTHLFKTDDDSYVDLLQLYNELHNTQSKTTTNSTTDSSSSSSNNNNNDQPYVDYWGKCNDGSWKPHRNKDIPWQAKWYISYEVYPEPNYPPYCQGAGFAVSKKFLDCAVGTQQIAQVRYMPNEDVAVGMLAQRCRIAPTNDDRVWIRWEYDEHVTHEKVREQVSMLGKIVQHYVKTEELMRDHHFSATGVRGVRLLD